MHIEQEFRVGMNVAPPGRDFRVKFGNAVHDWHILYPEEDVTGRTKSKSRRQQGNSRRCGYFVLISLDCAQITMTLNRTDPKS